MDIYIRVIFVSVLCYGNGVSSQTTNTFCMFLLQVQQPMMVPGAASMGPPQDYMCAAIFVTLCCFWPTGIIAIMKANDVSYKYRSLPEGL